jgi:lysylphosphatidylglycerol synthetase-like protein (DUF2156 family)
MIAEFTSSPQGAYVLSLVLGLAVGLVAMMRGFRAWLATMLVTIAVVLLASSCTNDAPFAVPLYVVTLGVTAIVLAAADLRDSPLLVDEPWWRKVLLVAVHGRVVREAAASQQRG